MKEGWEIKKLKEIGEIQTGTTPPTKEKDNYGEYISFVKPAHFEANGKIDSGNSMLSKKGLKKGRLIDRNSVLMVCIGATIGKVGFVDFPVSSNQQINALTPREGIDHKFIYYGMVSPTFQKEVVSIGTRSKATLPIINKTKWGNLQIPIPPLPEQKAIVRLLDRAFAAIDQAQVNLEKNIANAEELFQSKLNEIFSQRGEGWEERKLGDACKIEMGQSPKGTTYNDKGIGTPLLNGPVEFGPYPFSETVEKKWTTDPKKMCKKGDLILCVRGSTTGRINLAGFDACIGRGVASIRYTKNQYWLNYFIRSKQEEIFKLGTGSTFPNVSSKEIKNISFPEPPLETQAMLVDLMSNLEENIEKIIQGYHQKRANLFELKKSLLQKAFAGELSEKSAEQLLSNSKS